MMKREEIEKMPAGREMDALIAEKVMGWNTKTTPHMNPSFSTVSGVAIQIVEKMIEYEKFMNGADQIIITRSGDRTKWYVEFRKPNWEYAEDASLALSICRAALLAVCDETH